MKRHVPNNPWGLMEYLNNAEYGSMDFSIGQFLYEHRNEIDQMTVEEIAEKGCFSQASVSRFLNKTGFGTFKHFKEISTSGNIINSTITEEYEDQMTDYHSLLSNIEEMIDDSKESLRTVNEQQLKVFAGNLLKARRIVFVGYSLCIAAFKITQNVLVHKRCNVYAPNDYTDQRYFMEKTYEHDVIVSPTLSSKWYKNGFEQFVNEFIPKTNAKKYLITTQNQEESEKWFDETFALVKDNHGISSGEYLRLYAFDALLSSYLMQD